MRIGNLASQRLKFIRFTVVSLLPVLLMAVAQTTGAQTTFLAGTVTDSITHEPIPYVALFLTGTNSGGLTDDNGRFQLRSSSRADSLKLSVMGYRTKSIPLKTTVNRRMNVQLAPVGVALSEVVVKPKKEKYSKKNNPAVIFLNRIRAAMGKNDPKRNDFYNYEKYERLTMALNDFDPETNYAWMGKKFKFLKDHVDISEISGKPILNFIVKEKVSDVNYRKSPHSQKEHVNGMRQEGIDDILSNQESSRQFLEDVFREIDIYGNDVNLLQKRFVSPLSRIATDFYKFYLNDTVVVESDSCVVLSFVPHTSETWGFIVKIYVPKNDSTMFIKKIEMHLPHTINVNFMDAMSVTQTYEKSADGSRLKTRDDMTVELSVLPGLPQLYVRRNTIYSGFNFDEPENAEVFNLAQREIISDDASEHDNKFWEEKRPVPMEQGESSVGELLSSMREVPVYYWTERVLKLMANGYVATGNPSKFDYGPIMSTISYNTAEGLRLRVGGMTTANLSKRWFTRGYLSYGFRDHRWKYEGEVEYSFNDKKYHSREFPVHSIRATSSYDIDQLGQNYLTTYGDNVFLSVKRLPDTRVTYKRSQVLEYNMELYNNFSLGLMSRFERQEESQWIQFIDGHGNNFPHYNELTFTLKLRYAPGEKFIQGKSDRRSINRDAPVFELIHTYAPKGLGGTMFPINRTELRFSKRFWLSAFGHVDAIVKGGHAWEASPYMNLFLPSANLSYLIQAESFALMNPLEFVNDSYAMVDFTYWMDGMIFNRIPLLKKLRLREVMSFKALWGHLSPKNNPDFNKDLFVIPSEVHTTLMSNVPYMEASVGVDNIFSIFRLDAVWRLSYRNAFDAPNWGIRAGFHVTF